MSSDGLTKLADDFDNIEVDADGKCNWTDVANAQTHLRAQLRRYTASQEKQEPVAWQRRVKYPDAPGATGEWLQCSESEATDPFARRVSYEYRPLYISPQPSPGWDSDASVKLIDPIDSRGLKGALDKAEQRLLNLPDAERHFSDGRKIDRKLTLAVISNLRSALTVGRR